MPKATVSNFPCAECLKDFTRQWDLERHVSDVHRKLRPFVCRHCHKNFGQSGTLVTHIRAVHSSEKPVSCRIPGCDERFGDASARTRHEYGMHAAPGFVCPEIGCGGAFKRKEVLKAHVTKEHPGRWHTYTSEQTKNQMTAQRFREEVLEPGLASAANEEDQDEDEDEDHDGEDGEPLPTPLQKQRLLKRRRHHYTAGDDNYDENAGVDPPPQDVVVNLHAPEPPFRMPPPTFESQMPVPAIETLPEGVPAGLGGPAPDCQPVVFGPSQIAYPYPFHPGSYTLIPTASVPQAYTNSNHVAYGTGNALGLVNVNAGFIAPPPPPSGFSYFDGGLYVDPRVLTVQGPQPPPPTPVSGTASTSTAFTNTSVVTPPQPMFTGAAKEALQRQRVRRLHFSNEIVDPSSNGLRFN
ncbi:hypothetical protein FRB98_009161 [Tulasnella sp. 332]|nr:hypothetical protein FRB98_009161 [Tulasnella sp. 332]